MPDTDLQLCNLRNLVNDNQEMLAKLRQTVAEITGCLSKHLPVVLLVDDDPEDVFLLKEGLSEAKCECDLRVLVDGTEAIKYLLGNGKYEDRVKHPFPALLVLDLNLPNHDGFEILAMLKANPRLNLRTVIVSGSNSDADRERAFSIGVEAFFTKPADFAGFVEVSHHIRSRLQHAARAGRDLKHKN